ncbi:MULTISPECIES: hypothetical protein [Nostoc]|uniref:Uncharacterized protein n=1 Tax=Nostoc paludosum FACHB-159 TaxID=2692908 RepID=A0ABR8KHD8_9NOSO|nr:MULTISPECIES: hypothetical protein [Nostoc]MBD2680982.1 hypothetical protein [Nostoc sp. FACHB-857]MBD2737472.1 hypothetical protein [Nostoc paludosum FACHB-159]
MTVNNGLILTLFVVITTSLALGYGFGVKARRLPFTAEIGYSQKQWQFLQWWVKLALVTGILLPICLLVLAWRQPSSWVFWGSYLLIVAVQLICEYVFSRWLVPSVVVPIGFFYTAFRLWQLLDGFTQLTFSYLTLVGFSIVVLFWVANLVMLMVMPIPTIFVASESISQ